ncbi:MAG: RNA pseudouridine synthase [Bacteroidota bacterium]
MRENNIDYIASSVLFEDNHIIIINKKPSEIVQGDKTGDTPLSEKVKLYIKEKYEKPGNVYLGVVHRIDRPVSGIVLFARTDKALTRLNNMLRDKEISKKYWAVVKNKPPAEAGNLKNYIKKNEANNKSYILQEGDKGFKEAQYAELNYRLIAQSEQYYLLEVELLTGRHHQIRAQLSEIGCPIKGDVKYGANRTNPDASIHLHARSIRFIHPVSQQEVYIVAPPPAESLWDYFRAVLG